MSDLVRVIPLERFAGRLIDRRRETIVMRDNLERQFVSADDNCRRDRKGVEQAGVVRHHQVRSSDFDVRPALLLGSIRAPSGSLHCAAMPWRG